MGGHAGGVAVVPRTVCCAGYEFRGRTSFARNDNCRDWDVGGPVKRGDNGEMQRM